MADFIYIFLIAVSLALDAFAVSVSSGLTVKGFNIKHALLMGAYFGGFQFIMPLIGWFLGSTIAGYVSAVSPYIAFALLAIIGGNMIRSSLKGEDEEALHELTHSKLLMLAIATSIDALAVGVTFAFMDINIWYACTIIGVVAFALSIVGGMLGGKLGEKFSGRAGIFGGIVLIGIGLKILIESFL